MKPKPKTYSAIFLTGTPGKIVYRHEPEGNLWGLLPLGALPFADDPGTLTRTDGGDPWECARFVTPSGRIIEVKLD